MIKLREMSPYLMFVCCWIIFCQIGTASGQNHDIVYGLAHQESCITKEGAIQPPTVQAFIQIDKELKYLVDGVTVHMSDMFKGSSGGALAEGGSEARFGGAGGGELLAEDRLDSHRPPPPHKNYIQFDPPQLDFKEHPVGMPVMRKVVVRHVGPGVGGGTADSAAVQLHSLSGNTLHFHCTFFQDKVVSAYSNTTFDVVFLGREEGVIENTIFIHTSIGTYKYAVRAVGTTNPYRLRPLVGVRMPLNSSYTPLIRLHNPHPYTLQVREMYSSGGDLHLELLGGAVEGDASHWSIPPYHTRPLARATFVARRENNHTAYIRIVTAGGEGAYLVVPVEVEVSGEPGLYSPHDGLHFPLLTPHHAPATLPLMLLNSAHKHIHIQNVITTPVNDAITVDFKPVKIPPGSVKPTQVATVTVDPSKMRRGGALHGKLLVKSKVSAYKLSVPFSVTLLHGHLRYNPAVTTFYTGPPHLDPASSSAASGSRRSAGNTSSSTNFSHFSFPSFPSLSSSSSSSLSSSLSWSSSLSSSSTVSLLEPSSSSLGGEDGASFSSGGSVGAAEPSSENGPPLLYRPGEPRNLSLSNTFLCPVVVYNVTLPAHARKHFKVVWRGEVVLPEGGEGTVASIQLLSVGSELRLRAHLTVHTNITSVTIPVTAYNGRLSKHLSSTGFIDWDHPGLRALTRTDRSLLPDDDSSKESFKSSSSSDDSVEDDDEEDEEDEEEISSGIRSGVKGRRVGGDGGLPETVDLGTVGMSEQRDLHFYVVNENPVSLRLDRWSGNASWCEVELLSVGARAGGELKRSDEDRAHNALWVGPGEVALFRVAVLTPGVEGVFWGASAVHTPFETLKLAFKLRTAVGQLTMIPTPVLFEEAYPGKVSSVPLEVLSTFGHSMKVQDVLPHLPSDPEFWYRGAPDGEAFTLAPDMRTNIGHLLYDPRQHCSAHCYAGFALADKLGQQWSNSLALAGHVADTDAALLSGLRQRYTNLSAPTFNTSLVLHTSHLHAFPFTVQVSLVWPRVVMPRELVFPLTQLRNTTVASLPLVNPTTESLYVQVLFLHQHPSPHLLAEALTHQLEFSDLRTDGSDSDLFRLVDLDSTISSSGSASSGVTTDSCSSGSSPCPAEGGVSADPAMASGVAQHRKQVEADLATRVAKETMVFRLGPGDHVDVRVSFRPVAAGVAQSVLLVRNNLTVVDAVLLRGAGGQGAIKFGNRKPDSTTTTPLTFSLAAKHLKDCDASHRAGTASREPKLTVKRTFTARNTGDLPVTVDGFLVAGTPCEAYGFKVIHCDPFTLEPNASRKIDIAFSPDFTLSKVQQSLQLLSSSAGEQQLVYTLQATVPASLLAACASALPRPHWEPLLYYTVLTLLAVMLAATLLIAMMDADILVKENVTNMTANQPPQHLDKDKVFDLRALATTVKDTGKKPVAAVAANNGACLNGHISNSHHHQVSSSSSSNTRAGYNNSTGVNSTNSNHNNTTINKRNSTHSINANFSNSNNNNNNNNNSNSIPNGKCKSTKSADYRSESVNNCNGGFSSVDSKAKDSRSKSSGGGGDSDGVNERQGISHFTTGIMDYVKGFVMTVQGLVSSGATASSTTSSSSSGGQSRRRDSGAASSRASPSGGSSSLSSSTNNNNINKYQQLSSSTTAGSASDSRSSSSSTNNNNHQHNNNQHSSSSSKYNKYSKDLRNDAEYKGKDKSGPGVSRRASKETSFCDSSSPSTVAGGYSSPCYKASQKGREVEEETSSCTTESSNTEDLSISDKDSSSKSESTSSSRGAGNKAGNNGKSNNNKSTTKCGISNNHHKKIQKARSQPSLPSNSSSSSNNNISSSNSSNNNSSSPSPTTTAQECAGDLSRNSSQCLQAKDARMASDGLGACGVKDHDEADFKITVRGKGIKKGKACSVPVTDISADHCLELPYSPKTLKPPTQPSESLLRRTKNRTTRIQSESSVSSVVSPGTATVRPISAVAAECRAPISHNTANSVSSSLSGNHVAQPPPRPTPTTDLQPPNPRDSYSAKVLGHDKLKAKVTPVGKIMPEPKRVQPQRTLGAIGQKIPQSIPPFSQHSHLSLFSQELPSQSPLQQFYGSGAPQSFHSWDPRIVSPTMIPAQPAGLPPPGLAPPVGGLDGWGCKPALPQQQQLPQPSMNCKVPGLVDSVWSNEIMRQPAGANPLTARPPPLPPMSWDSSSIWSSSNTWRGAAAADLWPPSPNTAVVQGLGFDPVGVWRPSAVPADSSVDASGWPSSPPQTPSMLNAQPSPGAGQHSSPRKAKNI